MDPHRLRRAALHPASRRPERDPGPYSDRLLAPAPAGGARLPLLVVPSRGLALVPELLASRQRELDLDAALPEIETQRHEGLAARARPLRHLEDLLPVHQELARPQGLVIRVAAVV